MRIVPIVTILLLSLGTTSLAQPKVADLQADSPTNAQEPLSQTKPAADVHLPDNSLLAGLLLSCELEALMDGKLDPDADGSSLLSLALDDPWTTPKELLEALWATPSAAASTDETEPPNAALENLAQPAQSCTVVAAGRLAAASLLPQKDWLQDLKELVKHEVLAQRLALMRLDTKALGEVLAVWTARRQLAGRGAFQPDPTLGLRDLVAVGQLLQHTLPLTRSVPDRLRLPLTIPQLNRLLALSTVDDTADTSTPGESEEWAKWWRLAAKSGPEAVDAARAEFRSRQQATAEATFNYLLGVGLGQLDYLRATLNSFVQQIRLEVNRVATKPALPPSTTQPEDRVAQQQEAQPAVAKEAEQQAEAAERTAAAARQRQAQALKAAAEAQDQIQREMEAEKARLLGLLAEAALFESELQRSRQRFLSRQETLRQWNQRLEVLEEGIGNGTAPRSEADAAWLELKDVLHAEREKFEEAVSDEVLGRSRVPDYQTGMDLSVLPESARKVLLALRTEVVQAFAPLVELERKTLQERSDGLYQAVTQLDNNRIRLIGLLSEQEAAKVTGMGSQGWEQVLGALGQLAVTLQYRLVSLPRRLAEMWESAAQDVPAAIGRLLLALLFLFGGIWWYRRGSTHLKAQEEQARQRAARWATHAFWLAQRTHKPMVWLLAGYGLFWLVDGWSIRELAVVWQAIFWMAGGLLAVHLVDALVSSYERLVHSAATNQQLRGRSLRLVGFYLAFGGMLLGTIENLLGQGVLYRWAGSLWMVCALPVVFVVLRWWKPIIHQQNRELPNQNRFTRWVEGTPSGIPGWAAAAGAGLYLLARGLARWALFAASRLRLARRLHAWLFRRQIARQAKLQPTQQLVPLGESLALPLMPTRLELDCAVDLANNPEEQRILHAMGMGAHLVFLVGDRGMGKTTLMKRIEARDPAHALWLDCTPEGAAGLLADLAGKLNMDPGEAEEPAVLRRLAESGTTTVLVDEGQLLVHPLVYGLQDLERLRTWVRSLDDHGITWVVGLGLHAWRFVQRAAGNRLLADSVVELSPWEEEAVASLITKRTHHAHINPSFEGLVPQNAAEGQELPVETLYSESWYYRLLWDYSGGNPGIALHFWAQSLFADPDGHVFVRLFTPPPEAEIERLPLDMLFLLRVLVQMGKACPQLLAQATRLPLPEVTDALRIFQTRGFVESTDGVFAIKWHWRRAILKTLMRQHLLVV